MARVGFRPLPRHRILKGWRLQGFWTRDNYMENAPRNRSIFNTTFEHPYVNAGFDYIATTDKVSSAPTNGVDLYPTLDGKGWSFWVTPKKAFPNGSSIEGLHPVRPHEAGRHGQRDGDRVAGRPERADDRRRGLLVPEAGRRGSGLDARRRDTATFSNWSPAKPTQQRIFVHSLISF